MSNHALLPICWVDLDDTLFQSLRKTPLPHNDIAAVDVNNQPRSVFTPRQRQWLDWLLRSTQVIPVTARDPAQFKRVNIQFRSWAITTMGAVIMKPNGQEDDQWADQIVPGAQLRQYALRNLAAYATTLARPMREPISVRLVTHYDDVAFMLVIKTPNRLTTRSLHLQLQKHLEHNQPHHRWHIWQHDRQITIHHQDLTKRHAVEYLLERLRAIHGDVPTMGFGDALSDYGFMSLCDWRGVPANSALDQALAFCSHSSISNNGWIQQ